MGNIWCAYEWYPLQGFALEELCGSKRLHTHTQISISLLFTFSTDEVGMLPQQYPRKKKSQPPQSRKNELQDQNILNLQIKCKTQIYTGKNEVQAQHMSPEKS